MHVFFTLFFISFFSFSLNASASSEIQAVWAVNTLKDKDLGPDIILNSSPLLYKKFVIQGNAFDGIEAFTKKQGRPVWKYKIKGGVSSHLTLSKKIIYFGGADGFFYALRAKNGKLIWKFFTGSDNTGAPLVHRGKVYFVSSNQKIYALSINKGTLEWIHSGPVLSRNMRIRGQSRPAVFNKFLYVGFSEGSVLALNKSTGQLLWKNNLRLNHSILSDLKIIKKCILVPVFESGLFCLNLRNGRLIWKSSLGGATAPVIKNKLIYQGVKGRIYALRKRNGKKKWSLKVKGLPITPSFYKQLLVYGSLSDGSLSFLDLKSKKNKIEYFFGKGLSSPVTIDRKERAAYFISIEGYLRKIKLPKQIRGQ